MLCPGHGGFPMGWGYPNGWMVYPWNIRKSMDDLGLQLAPLLGIFTVKKGSPLNGV
jgi:hypothetical protein